MTKKTRIVVDIEVNAPPDLVWQALREPAEIRRWFGWDYPGLDQEIEAIFVRGAQVTEPGRVLAIIGADTSLVVRPSPRGATFQIVMPDSGPPPPYDEIEEGWIAFAHQLRLALERHRGQDRRSLQHRAPLRAAESQPPGAIPGPEVLSGTPWFHNQHQQAWLIPAWGDGLLIVNRSPPGPDAPLGKRNVLITTYGLEPEAFEQLRSRWTAWNAGSG
jgi:uncharacterized protein YndB with AHSA1/START domain